ncbi:MAG: DUF1735 domain-containing protein [Bacteroidales bacterium]|nr:DUF1735 domain-containing protein [Bacteroidales bacterium]
MKNINIIKAMAAGVLFAGFASCENRDIEFDDYEGGISVYFAYQTPIRSMMLGTNDNGSTADDETHTCRIATTMGGSYTGKDISVYAKIDESLIQNLYFDAACTKPVKVLPSSYYNYDEVKNAVFNYNGTMAGGVDVKLTDAFFADPLCAAGEVNYVIPMVIEDVTNGCKINRGTLGPGFESANRFDGAAWTVMPQDYVLYSVQYVSKYEGFYLPKGSVTTTAPGVNDIKKLEYGDWERVPAAEHLHFTTRLKDQVVLPIKAVVGNQTFSTEVVVNFSANNGTVVNSGKAIWEHDGISEEIDVTFSGSATYTDKDAKYNWAEKDRAGMKFNYTADFSGKAKVVADYDMALQRRGKGNFAEEFTVTLKK